MSTEDPRAAIKARKYNVEVRITRKDTDKLVAAAVEQCTGGQVGTLARTLAAEVGDQVEREWKVEMEKTRSLK